MVGVGEGLERVVAGSVVEADDEGGFRLRPHGGRVAAAL